jgi:hypothetical protein
MPANYDYSVSTDFPNQKVAVDRLTQEIDESSIQNQLELVNVFGDDCRIVFNTTLSPTDETTLDGIVAVHSGESLPSTQEPIPVKVIDTQGLDPATALSCTEFVEVEIHSGEAVSEGIISYPFPVDVAAARYVMDDTHYEYGDKFDVFGIPAGDPAIGGVTAPASQGDTSVHVSSTVFQYSRAGMYLKFQGHNDEYRIESVDSVAGTVELMAPLEQAVGAGETIQVRRPFLINGWVTESILYPIGDLTSGSSKLSAGDGIRIRYYHKTTPTEDYVLPFALAMLF